MLHQQLAEAVIRAPESAGEWDAYFDLRWRVLRQPLGQPIGSERDAQESIATHRAAVTPDGSLVGVARLHAQSALEGKIRYMAVEHGCRNAGIGGLLLDTLVREATSHGLSRLVLNARTEAVEFYGRRGFVRIGVGPTQFGIKHASMFKRLER